ncbi:MAG: hypothetical protein Q7S48_01170 [bacterium]|nr:hypothetical protein [bacterium]
MFPSMRFFLKKPINRYFGLANVIIIAVQIIALVWKMKPNQTQVFLHYTTYLGVDFVGAAYLLYGIPLGALFCTILNTAGAWYISKKNMFSAYLLIVGAFLINILLLVHAILLIRLNG